MVAGGAVRGRPDPALPVLRAGRQAAAAPSHRAVAGVVRHPHRRHRRDRRGGRHRHHAQGQPGSGRCLDRRARRRGLPQRGRPRRGRSADLARATPAWSPATPTSRRSPRSATGSTPTPDAAPRWCGPQGPLRAARALPGRPAAVDGRAEGRAGAVRLAVAGGAAHRSARGRWSGWCWPPSGTARAGWRSSASLPDGATWPINERSLLPWVRRRRVRRVAAFTLLVAGLLNVVFALLWPIRWTRPVDHWLPFGIHPVGGVTAVIGGLALAGVARGVRCGYRRAWVAALVILLVSTVNRLMHDVGLEGLGHRLPVRPVAAARAPSLPGQPGRACAASSAGPSWPASWWCGLAAGLDAVYRAGGRETRDVVVLAIVGTAVLVLVTALPGREHRRTGEERARAFVRARADLRPLRRRHPRLFRPARRQVLAVLREHPGRLLGHQPRHARVARPDRAGRRAPRRLVRRHGPGRRQRVVHLRARRLRAVAADLPGGRADRGLHG